MKVARFCSLKRAPPAKWWWWWIDIAAGTIATAAAVVLAITAQKVVLGPPYRSRL